MPSATASDQRVCSGTNCSCAASILVSTDVVDRVTLSARYRSSLFLRTRPLSEQAAMRSRACLWTPASGAVDDGGAVVCVDDSSLLIGSAPAPSCAGALIMPPTGEPGPVKSDEP